jgi:hypothetical protein
MISDSPHLLRSRRSGPKSIFIGILSVLPLASVAACVVTIAVTVVLAVRSFDDFDADPDPFGAAAGGALFVALGILAGVSAVVALLVLLIDVFSNPAVAPEDRLVWLVCLLFANVFAYPAYWYAIWWRGGQPAGETVTAAGR